jgi:hypothetical protein
MHGHHQDFFSEGGSQKDCLENSTIEPFKAIFIDHRWVFIIQE